MISDIHKIEKLINSQLSSKIYESSIQNDELIILINENDPVVSKTIRIFMPQILN